MEEPDLEELEWMAGQQFAQEQQDEDLYLDAYLPTPDTLASPAIPQNPKQTSQDKGTPAPTILIEKPWSPPPPPPSREALPTSPREQGGAPAIAAEPPVPCKLPYRRAADIDGEFMSITGPAGERVYAAKSEVKKESYNSSGLVKGLLSQPIETMIQQVEHAMFEQVIAASEKKEQEGDLQKDAEAPTLNESLWVEKYAPRSFTDLLSDEQTNREVLRWLKQWDLCVFGAKQSSTSGEVQASLRRHVSQKQGRAPRGGPFSYSRPSNWSHSPGSNGTNRQSYKSSSDTFLKSEPAKGSPLSEQSVKDKPEERVLLLCGPPGLGKTTLAHVAAKHCGYRVVEINASDDQVATTLQAKILDAIQMKSVTGDKRPNCLVIDEIDGIMGGTEGKGAVDALVEMINAEKNSPQQKENEAEDGFIRKGSKKKGHTAVHRLSRPVICICNDLYAPALRALRQVARVHVFMQPSTNRVVSRLKYICSTEGYKTNARALTALAEHTECDIRSCLNTLQFLNRKKHSLKTVDVASQVIGRKDMTSSIFDIWGEVFQRKKMRKGAVIQGIVNVPDSGGGQDYKDFARLHELFSNHGDYELTMDGIHENILQMRYHDASLQKTVEALEWMGDSDMFGQCIQSKQHYFLLAYQPSMELLIRRLVAQEERPQIEWPRSYQRFRLDRAVKKEMISSWLAAMVASVSRSVSPACLAQDIVTPLLSILSPPTLRPVASHLLNPNEKEEMVQLVDTMLAFGLLYKHSKPSHFTSKTVYGGELQGVLVLDPPIDSLVKFKDHTVGHRELSATLRQMLTHEVFLLPSLSCLVAVATSSEKSAEAPTADALATRGRDVTLNASVGDGPKTEVSGNKLSVGDQSASSMLTPNIEVGKVEVKKHQPYQSTNFFERFKKSGQNDAKLKGELATLQRDSRPLLYKFHEGFTNAVKRPMLVRDFL
ncbi:unnamed protein product [Sphagnum jensenii]|uniref:AAA+ ATPase domain-containing protein n=1 Tax=Sphagnum jensenii TaxID=128206 RepID=A0ABP1AVL6_9BRYO